MRKLREKNFDIIRMEFETSKCTTCYYLPLRWFKDLRNSRYTGNSVTFHRVREISRLQSNVPNRDRYRIERRTVCLHGIYTTKHISYPWQMITPYHLCACVRYEPNVTVLLHDPWSWKHLGTDSYRKNAKRPSAKKNVCVVAFMSTGWMLVNIENDRMWKETGMGCFEELKKNSVTNEWVWNINGIILTEESLSTRTNTCPTATPSTNSTWTGLEQNPDISGERRTTTWVMERAARLLLLLRRSKWSQHFELNSSSWCSRKGLHSFEPSPKKHKTKITNVSKSLVPIPRTPCQYGAPCQL